VTQPGINIDPFTLAPDPQTLIDLGFQWVRLVSKPGAEVFADQYGKAGLKVLAVVTADSNGLVIATADEPSYPA